MCVHVYIMCMHKLTYLIKTITIFLNLNNYNDWHFEENNIEVQINNGNDPGLYRPENTLEWLKLLLAITLVNLLHKTSTL